MAGNRFGNNKWRWTTWKKYVTETKAPLGTARTCKLCGHYEIVRSGLGMGRGYGMREGNKARGRMIQHLKEEHGLVGDEQ